MGRGSRTQSTEFVERIATTVLLVLGCVLAQAAPVAADPPAQVGDDARAMPGLARLRVATERPVGFAVRGSIGFGYTESLNGAPGPHYRLSESLGVSGHPLPWLGLSLLFDGHADFHPDDGMGKDRGFVGSGAFEVRATPRIGEHFSTGVALALGSYGGDAPSFDLSALSFEGTALVAYGQGGLVIGAEVGYRVDRSANTVPSGIVFRPGDRMALGVSDFDAVLVRLGASQRAGRFEGFGEIAWNLLVGSGAPPVDQSPLHVSAGARFYPIRAMQLELLADVCASARPTIGPTQPYVPIDPRFSLVASVAYRFGGYPAPRATGASGTDTTQEGDTSEPTGSDAGREGNGATPAGGRTVEGTILDARGEPLVDAHVVLEVDGERREGYTDGSGRFRLEGVPAENGTLTVEAVGHATRTVPVRRGVVDLPADGLAMSEEAPHGVVRGLVRDYDGTPVRATIRVTPGSRTTQASADGSFELELEPGRYRVTVTAQGFASQDREITLSTGEVTILNVDLRRSH